MQQCPKVYKLMDLIHQVKHSKTRISISTGPHSVAWVPCRGINYSSIRTRLKAAWLVFTGRADAVVWPGDQ